MRSLTSRRRRLTGACLLVATASLTMVAGRAAATGAQETGTVSGRVEFCDGGGGPLRDPRHPSSKRRYCEGEPVGVVVVDAENKLVAYTHTKSGRFKVLGLAPGAYTVIVHPDRRPSLAWPRPATVQPGQVADIGNLAPPVP